MYLIGRREGIGLPPTNRPSNAPNTSPAQPKPEGAEATSRAGRGLSDSLQSALRCYPRSVSALEALEDSQYS